MSDAELVVALANAQATRRPTHARTAVAHDALSDAANATELLKPFLGRAVDAHELAAVRALQRAVVVIVDALIDRSQPSLEPVNALAARAPATYSLRREPNGTLQATLTPKRASAATALLIETMRQLSELDPSRLRRCARPECKLVFYDLTRSSTRRWHSDRPCGLRERQRRHRTNATSWR